MGAVFCLLIRWFNVTGVVSYTHTIREPDCTRLWLSVKTISTSASSSTCTRQQLIGSLLEKLKAPLSWHTDITRKRETKAKPPSAYRKLWNKLSIIGVHLKHNRTKFWALRNSIIGKNISIIAASLLADNYRIRGNFRASDFRITTKWNISNGFIFEFPARPPREKLRCPLTH